MSAQKLLVLMVMAVLAVMATSVYSNPQVGSYAANKSHHLIVGTRMPGDRITLRQNIIKKSAWMQIVTTQQTFNVSRYERITMVRALDQKTNGNGAYASLLGGGPGANYTTLRFKSQRGHGINFIVEIYSRP